MRKLHTFILLFFMLLITSSTQTNSSAAANPPISTKPATKTQTLHHPPIPAEPQHSEKIAIVMLDKPQSPRRILADFPELELRSIFEYALTGFSVKGPQESINKLASQSNIVKVSLVNTYQAEEIPSAFHPDQPSSDGNLKIIGTNEIRGLYDHKNQRLTGKGVKVGIIDTGIDYTHPDLRANYKGGHDLVDNDQDPMETKGISGMSTLHGTHVAGIIAANGRIRGVAPEADLIAYRALGPGGSGTTEQVIAAIEQAIIDKVDILNLSLGNGVNGPDLPISVALNHAVEQGITAVTSSGNSGPNRWTVGSPGTAEKAISVGASTPPLKIPYLVMPRNQKIRIDPMHGSRDWDSPDSADIALGGLGRMKDLKDVKGKIVLVERGEITFTEKAKNAAKAGAKAVIISNNTNGSFIGNLQETVPIPVASISKKGGENLRGNLPIKISVLLIEESDILADFSSRGPVTITWDIKPDVVAPGVAISSTIPGGYLALQGTSMAAPHVAGACALIKQAHPDWGPDQIKASLMNTAKPIFNQNELPYKTYEQGAGRIQPAEAVKTETLVTPGSLKFGKFQLKERMHKHEAFIKIKNMSSFKKNYHFSIPKNELGINWSLPLNFSIGPNEEKQFNISMTIDPVKFTHKIYDGYLVMYEGSKKIRIPYLYVLEEPDYPRVMGFEFGLGDKEKFYRYEVYLPGGADEFGIALFHPGNYQFAGFLDWKRDVSKGLFQNEVRAERLPAEGLYLAKVFAKKGGKEDMIETMIEILPQNGTSQFSGKFQ